MSPLGSETREHREEMLTAPPWAERWRYELYGWRLPPQYRAWAERDIRSRWWPWKRIAVLAGPFTAMLLVFTAADGWNWSRFAFYPGFFLVYAVAVKRDRELALRRQDPDEPPRPHLSPGQRRAVVAMVAVAGVAIALIVAFRAPLNDAVHPHRCTAVPAATRAVITDAADAGATIDGFQQRRHGRWTGIAAIVSLDANRTVATWVEDRSVTPYRISAADTYAAARTPALPPLDGGRDYSDAVTAARSALSCPLR